MLLSLISCPVGKDCFLCGLHVSKILIVERRSFIVNKMKAYSRLSCCESKSTYITIVSVITPCSFTQNGNILTGIPSIGSLCLGTNDWVIGISR